MRPYDSLPGSARVWVYQSDRAFSDTEIQQVSDSASRFLTSWTAHGASLDARIDVVYAQFIRVAVDESTAGASGCSIDKLTIFIRHLEQKYTARLLDTMAVGYRQGEEFRRCDRDEFQRRVDAGSISSDTIVFDNSVTTKEAFDSRWEIPITRSWHREFLRA